MKSENILDQSKVIATFNERHSSRKGVTFVACYGIERWPSEFASYYAFLEERLNELLDGWIRMGWLRVTRKDQTHITGIGLEGTRKEHGIENTNLAIRNQKTGGGMLPSPVETDGLVEYLRASAESIKMQLGGYGPTTINPYDNRPPFERSFQVQPNGLLVAIGWPVGFLPQLLELRTSVEKFNLVHKYHIDPKGTKDNDGFIVLGEVTNAPWMEQGSLAGKEREQFEHALWRAQALIREQLSTTPFVVPLGVHQWSVVKYSSTDLSFSDAIVVAVEDLSESRLIELYT